MTSSAGYMRAWRQANPDKVDRSRQVNACRKRAMTRLAAKYPAVLAVLMRDELEKAGLVDRTEVAS